MERPDNKRMITLWEHFDRDAIMNDFYATMERPVNSAKVANGAPFKPSMPR